MTYFRSAHRRHLMARCTGPRMGLNAGWTLRLLAISHSQTHRPRVVIAGLMRRAFDLSCLQSRYLAATNCADRFRFTCENLQRPFYGGPQPPPDRQCGHRIPRGGGSKQAFGRAMPFEPRSAHRKWSPRPLRWRTHQRCSDTFVTEQLGEIV